MKVHIVLMIGHLCEGGVEVFTNAFSVVEDALRYREETEERMADVINDPDSIYEDYEVRIDDVFIS